MLTIYLVSLVFGWVFLLIAVFADSDLEGGPELNGGDDVESDFDMDSGDSEPAGLHKGEITAAVQFLSFRNLVFFLAFFGLTGSALTWLDTPFLLTLFLAVGMGVLAWTLTHKVISYLRQSESGQGIHVSSMEGLPAQVTVDLSRSREGKISVNTNDRLLQLLARVAEESNRDAFARGESVIILRVEKGIAYVVGEDFIL